MIGLAIGERVEWRGRTGTVEQAAPILLVRGDDGGLFDPGSHPDLVRRIADRSNVDHDRGDEDRS